MTQAAPQTPNPQARLGANVTVELIDAQGAAEPMTFDIVREQFADLDRGLLGVQTPLAKAIIGKAVGAVVQYQMGDIRQVRVVSVQPSQHTALENQAEARKAKLQAALETVERTNAEVFAASYTGKWGGYDLPDKPTA
ncbi:MAG: GreA/GreB family elongation factor [Caldilineaceae bacterium]